MISQLHGYKLPDISIKASKKPYVSARADLIGRTPEMYFEDPDTKTIPVTQATVDLRIIDALG